VLGEAAHVVLAPDLRTVHVDVEDSAGAFDELGAYLKLLLDRIRQTGGRGKVVSLRAVLDGDVHLRSPVSRTLGPEFGLSNGIHGLQP
jgi:hypothetical protein